MATKKKAEIVPLKTYIFRAAPEIQKLIEAIYVAVPEMDNRTDAIRLLIRRGHQAFVESEKNGKTN